MYLQITIFKLNSSPTEEASHEYKTQHLFSREKKLFNCIK